MFLPRSISQHFAHSDVCIPTYFLRSAWLHLRGKKIVTDHRSVIRGLGNIETKGRLTLGKYCGDVHPSIPASLQIEGKLIVEKTSYVGKGCHLSVQPGAKIILHGCHLTGGCTIIARHHVEIGEGCVIAWGTEFLDWDSHRIVYEGKSAEKPARVILEDHVWVGAGARILRGVTIGTGSVVAAGAVVTRSCPPNVLLAGNPARVIREGVSWGDYDV